MKLAGQGNGDPVRTSERGYAMAALLVSMSVMAVLMTAALPSWTHMAQREKEEEYLFRAMQYARAIRLFQTKMQVQNVAAPSVDFLVEQRFLRKKYKDPITGEDFVLIQTPVGSNLPGMPSGQPPMPGQPRGAGQPQGAWQQSAPGQAMGAQPGAQGAKTGGFIGVTSKSKAQAIRLFKGQQTTYDQWAITFMDVNMSASGIFNPGGNAGPFGPGGGPNTFQPSGGSPFAPGRGMGGGGFGQPMPGSPFGQPMQPGGQGPTGTILQPPGGGQTVPKFPPFPGSSGSVPFQPAKPSQPPR